MNDDWVETTLGDCCTITIGRTPPRGDSRYWTQDLTRPFCTIADMNGEMVTPSREGVTELAEAEGKAKRFPAGSLLMSFKLTIGRMGFAACDVFPNEAIAWLEVQDPTLDVRFLSLWLASRDLSMGSGRAVKGNTLNSSSMNAITVPVPPLPVQRRIVDLMAHLDNQIANLRLERDAAKVSADALSESLIGIHPVQSVRDVADENRGLVGGPFGSSLVNKDYSETGIPVVRGTNMPKTGRYLQPPFVFVSSEKADSLKANWAMDGDVVFTQRGTLGQVGLVAVGQGPLVISQSQMRLRPNPSVALSEYVYYAFSRPSVVSGIQDLNTATANPHINLGILAAIEFPVPSLEIQRAICVDLAVAYDLSAALQAEIESLLAFRSVLLSQLLTNKIGLPETYDSLLEVVA